MRTSLRALAAAALVVLLGCPNAGEDRLLTVGATGVVNGFVVFDVNGSRSFDPSDDSVAGIRIRLVTTTSGDTVARGTSLASGAFTLDPVPAGTYRVVVDTTTLADTAVVAKLDSTQVTIGPADTTRVNVLIGYPHVTILEARTSVPLLRRVFIEGIALNSPSSFRDTTMHVQDTSAAIRLTRIRTTPSAPGDSIRVRGTTSQRNGQRTLDDVSTFFVGPSFLPPTVLLTTAVAAGAENGTRDAQLVQVNGATISDTAYVVAIASYRLTVSDGSGSLEVILDGQADPNFRLPGWPGPAGAQYVPGNVFNVVGLLVPSGVAGVWQLKPRSSQDLVKQ